MRTDCIGSSCLSSGMTAGVLFFDDFDELLGCHKKGWHGCWVCERLAIELDLWLPILFLVLGGTPQICHNGVCR